MKFTLTWLNQFISTEGFTPAQIAERLTMLGLEVDSITELFTELDEVLTARVLTVEKHPDADKLTVCTVDIGTETVQVVCGAPNVRPGLLTAIARPGVQLPDGIKIKKAKVRGLVSEGMLCSSRELGLNDEHSGILELDETLSPGLPLAQAMGLRDTVIEVDLTPNRADCASVRGIAREVGSFTGGVLQPLVRTLMPLQGKETDYEVLIKAPDLCTRYAARKLTSVRIAPSPPWMQQRLLAVGMRPINNIVDITNYVMLESGQPLHAFDFATLKGKKIIVRRPEAGEISMTTLDGSQRQLDADMLLICDAERPVALAGVMGGLETEITDATTDILLESACFNPVSIRKTARSLGIPSEASYRFERGVDPNLADSALQRAVDLMVAYAGATADPDGVDVYPGKKDPVQLQLRADRACSLLGMDISAEEMAACLKSIEFDAVTVAGGNTLQVQVPSFRVDIEREIDLVEEVARLIGYSAIPVTQPLIRMDSPQKDELRGLRGAIAHIMISQGFFEAINYSFVPEKYFDFCRLPDDDPRRQVTRLLNPISEDQGVMRPILLPGMLENVRRNLNFQQNDIRLFETGKVFYQKQEGQLPEERYQFCALISGCRYPYAESLHFSGQEADFFDIKGAAHNLLETLGLEGQGKIRIVPLQARWVEPYCDPACTCAIVMDERKIGLLGLVHPEILKNFSIKQAVHFFEMDLQQLVGIKVAAKQFHPLPKYPAIKRDISLIVPETIPAGDLVQAIYNLGQKHLSSAEIFDIYQGASIPEGYKSIALSVTYRSASGTLDDRSVEKIHEKVVDALTLGFKARYREGSEQ